MGLSVQSHPLEVARSWARALTASRIDDAVDLLAPAAHVHVDGRTLSSSADLEAYLASSPLAVTAREPVIRRAGDIVVLRWAGTGDLPPAIEVRCRILDGQITEAWILESTAGGGTVAVRTGTGLLQASIVTRGEIGDVAVEHAAGRVSGLLEHITDPVLSVRLVLDRSVDPARARPVAAKVIVDINGDVVRAHVSGDTVEEAVDLLAGRLRDQLEHRSERRHALRRRSSKRQPGEWRHGDQPTVRPDHFVRPADERELVRHKAYVAAEMTPEEAEFDMEQLDFEFFLFRDLATGDDALIQRVADGSTSVTRLHADSSDGPSVPTLSVDQAVEHLSLGGEPFVFFANATTGRGNIVYVRDDGHYGLIALE